MRVFFVGIHHKDGKPALCSSTKSGKVIDKVISRVKEYSSNIECVKTNLFNANFELPTVEPVSHWSKRVGVRDHDIAILLGGKVTKYFKRERRYTYTLPSWYSVVHPSRAGAAYTDLVFQIIKNEYIKFLA